MSARRPPLPPKNDPIKNAAGFRRHLDPETRCVYLEPYAPLFIMDQTLAESQLA